MRKYIIGGALITIGVVAIAGMTFAYMKSRKKKKDMQFIDNEFGNDDNETDSCQHNEECDKCNINYMCQDRVDESDENIIIGDVQEVVQPPTNNIELEEVNIDDTNIIDIDIQMGDGGDTFEIKLKGVDSDNIEKPVTDDKDIVTNVSNNTTDDIIITDMNHTPNPTVDNTKEFESNFITMQDISMFFRDNFAIEDVLEFVEEEKSDRVSLRTLDGDVIHQVTSEIIGSQKVFVINDDFHRVDTVIAKRPDAGFEIRITELFYTIISHDSLLEFVKTSYGNKEGVSIHDLRIGLPGEIEGSLVSEFSVREGACERSRVVVTSLTRPDGVIELVAVHRTI